MTKSDKRIIRFASLELIGIGLMLSMNSVEAAPGTGPFDTPDYFAQQNYAYSPLPEICDGVTDTTGAGGHCTISSPAGSFAGGLHKFVDGLPRLSTAGPNDQCSTPSATNGANNLGHCLLVATPDQTTFAATSLTDKSGSVLSLPATDYYSIELKEYTRVMHTDLSDAPTLLRGYHQLSTPGNLAPNTEYQYLSPVIIAARNRPTRLKFTNSTQFEIPLPSDQSYFGAGSIDYNGTNATPGTARNASSKRANLHLHGGDTPWISDGTPHTWITPANDANRTYGAGFAKGLSFQNVPDMVTGGWLAAGCGQTAGANECLPQNGVGNDGIATYYYPNGQSSRTMFYHDHSFGITRLNVYMGEAAPYLLADQKQEDTLQGLGVPGYIKVAGPAASPTGIDLANSDIAHLIPLVIQDKTFVPDNGQAGGQLAAQDPTWPSPTNAKSGTSYNGKKYWLGGANGNGTTNTLGNGVGPNDGWGRGSLWLPHVYVTNQLPQAVPVGTTGFSTVAPIGRWDYTPWMGAPLQINNPPVSCTTAAYPGVPFTCPAMANPTAVPESFMDTIVVNGTVYPHLDVTPSAYRFKMLNAADDRFFNVGVYIAVTQDPIATIVDTTTGSLAGGATAEATIVGGQVSSFQVIDPGVNYPPSPTVNLSFLSGTSTTSTGATAYAAIGTDNKVLKLTPNAGGTGFNIGDYVVVTGDTAALNTFTDGYQYGVYQVTSGNCQGAGNTDCSITALTQTTAPSVVSGLTAPSVAVNLNYGVEANALSGLSITPAKGIATIDITGSVIDVIPDPLNLGSGYVAGGQSCENVETKIVPLCTEVKQVYPAVNANTCTGSDALTLGNGIDDMGLVHVADLSKGRTGMASNCWPTSWPSDGNAHSGLVPDARYAGPPIIQLGNEGGLLPNPLVIPSTPISYNYNRKMATVLGFTGGHGLNLAPAQRVDAVIDFHGFAPTSGKTTVLIAYNDHPAPAPLFDVRYDMYTGDPDNSASGGAPSTLPGFGPNTRTLLQIRVSGTGDNTAINIPAISSTVTGIPALFASTQDKIIVPQPNYPQNGLGSDPGNGYTKVPTAATFNTVQLPNADTGALGGINVMNGGAYAEVPSVVIGGNTAPVGGTLARATANLAGTSVAALNLTNAGTGYTTAPTVSITGGGGTGARYTAQITASALNNVTLANAGSGYPFTNPPLTIPTVYDGLTAYNCTTSSSPGPCASIVNGVSSVAVTNGGSFTAVPTLTFAGGVGTGAAGTATLSATGSVKSITVAANNRTAVCGRTTGTSALTLTGGTGFTGNATLTNGVITAVSVTNGGTGFTGTGIRATLACARGATVNGLTYNIGKTITGVTITNPGTGYTSAPTITTTPASTPTATFTATVLGHVAALTNANVASIKAAVGSSVAASTLTLPSAIPLPVGETAAILNVTHQGSPIASLTPVNPGTGYTSTPTVSITGGGGTGASALAHMTPRPIASFTLTNAGAQYTSVPAVTITNGVVKYNNNTSTDNYNSGDAGGIGEAFFSPTVMDYKAILEGFDPIWGTLNVELGDSIPAPGTVTSNNYLTFAAMPFGYVDPPSELVVNGGVADWRIDHIGVDAHSLHFHLFNVQIINYLDIAGQIYMPDSNQLGWNETVRTEPFTSVVVALRTKNVPIPWELPNSIRALDTTTYLGAVNGPVGCINNPFALQALIGPVCVPFTQTDPTANAVNITNALVNFGSEYVYHCHLLSHEEHDMMRPISFAMPPKKAPTLARVSTNAFLTITDHSFNETDFIIERSTNSTDGVNGTWTVIGDVQTGTGTGTGTTGTGVNGTTTTNLGVAVTMTSIQQTVNGTVVAGTPNPLGPVPGGALATPKAANTWYRASAANIVGCNWSVPALSSGNVPATAPPACSDIFTGWPSVIATSAPSKGVQ